MKTYCFNLFSKVIPSPCCTHYSVVTIMLHFITLCCTCHHHCATPLSCCTSLHYVALIILHTIITVLHFIMLHHASHYFHAALHHHYVALYYATLHHHCVALYYVAPRCTSSSLCCTMQAITFILHFIVTMLHFIMLHFIILHFHVALHCHYAETLV